MTHRVDNPRCTVPGRRVDGSPEVEEEDRCDTSTVEAAAWVVFGLNDTNVGTNYPHTDRSGYGTAKQQVPSSDLIDQEQEPHEGRDSLDHTENTGHYVHSVGVDTNL